MPNIFDNFNALTDGQPLSSGDWTVINISGPGVPTVDRHDVHSNGSNVIDNSDVGDNIAFHDDSVDSDDHSVELEVFLDSDPDHDNEYGVVARASSATATFNGYGADFIGNSPNGDVFASLIRYDSGVPTVLSTTSNLKVTYPNDITHLIRIDVNDDTIKMFIDDFEELSVTDATYSTGVRVGVHAHRSLGAANSQPFFDDFNAYEYVPPVIPELETEFDLGELPPGWSFAQNSVSNATISHDDDFASITIPNGTTSDTIFNASNGDNTAGLVYPIEDDFDIAVRIGSARNSDDSTMYGFILRGITDAEMIRWTPYSTGAGYNVYGYERSGGSGTAFQGAVGLAAAAGLPGGTSLAGSPAWMRAKRDGTDYTFYVSHDGNTWYEVSTVDSSVDAITIKLVVGQIDAVVGLPFRYDAVVDLLSKGSTDARKTEPVYFKGASQFTDFSSGVPAWLSLSSNLDGDSELVGDEVHISTTAGANGSYGRMSYVGTGLTANAGAHFRMYAPDRQTGSYSAFGIGFQDGGGDIDQYSPGPLFGFEAELATGTDNLPFIRAHRPNGVGYTLNEAYSFLTIEDYTPTALWNFRIEIFGDRVRLKHWSDAVSEPTAWNFDAEDRTLALAGPLVPFAGVSYNDGAARTATAAFDSVEFYELTDTQPEALHWWVDDELRPVTELQWWDGTALRPVTELESWDATSLRPVVLS